MDDSFRDICFIKHPPETDSGNENPPDSIVPFNCLIETVGFDQFLIIHSLLRKIEEDDNFIYMLELFIVCQKNGLYPPLDIMEWLTDSFDKWHTVHAHSANNTLTMDRALGLKGDGRTGNKMREAVRNQAKNMLMDEMINLKLAFGITNKQAAEMIEGRLKDDSQNQGAYPVHNYSADSLLHFYQEKYAKNYQLLIKENLRTFTADDKKELLLEYPPHSYQTFIDI